MAAENVWIRGKCEPEGWHPPDPRFGALWPNNEAGRVTCGIVVGPKVGNFIQASGGLKLNKVILIGQRA